MHIHMTCCLVALASVISCSLQQTASPPLEMPAVVTAAVNGTCPSAAVRDAAHQSIREQVKSLLGQVTPSLSHPPCPCGGPGDWTRIAFLNMSDPTQQCPPTWRSVSSTVRGCGHQDPSSTCDSATFPSNGRSYSRVCGRINAFQDGTIDAFHPSIIAGRGQIEDGYLDGVSLTHGAPGSRQHIWSFAGAYFENDPNINTVSFYVCPCTNTEINWPYQIPAFVGNNYFCDTANPCCEGNAGTVYADDPLWDGEGCGPTNACCELNRPPWFCTTLPQPTIDDIEARICLDEHFGNEDIIVSLIEIYVM